MRTMRAKMKISTITKYGRVEGKTESVTLKFNAVSASQYPADGSDEDNSFAKWTPNADLNMVITNPDLLDKFDAGQTFYVDFTKV
jgi:hypothetical protein